ncbi:hypothetical protein [Nocardia sp. CC201C]|uniref:hypothetical protein n=1 Tax=Nocardia sp. CC201C TaxID=3044575 RepID=UPI0024A7AFF1|nr:hypothetical protein [Nocardia sp. CC201C]
MRDQPAASVRMGSSPRSVTGPGASVMVPTNCAMRVIAAGSRPASAAAAEMVR